jgi:AraC-like DNA-binding protein
MQKIARIFPNPPVGVRMQITRFWVLRKKNPTLHAGRTMQTLIDDSLPASRAELQQIHSLPGIRALLAESGLDVLQTGPGGGPWNLAVRSWRGGMSVDLKTGAPALFFGEVPWGRTGYALPLAPSQHALFCGIPWAANAVGGLCSGRKFALSIPAGARLRVLLCKPRGWTDASGTPAFLHADPARLQHIAQVLFPENPHAPQNLIVQSATELERLEVRASMLPLRARRDSERSVAALEMFQADPQRGLSPVLLAAILNISLRTLENACLSITGHPPAALQRIVRLNAVRVLLEQGWTKKISTAADAVGLRHHGRFSGVYKDLFGESPRHTVSGRPR